MSRRACLLPTLGIITLCGIAKPQVPLKLIAARDLFIDAAANDLSPVGWMAVGPEGTIAVGQPQDNGVRFFSSNGKPRGMFGRRGTGPGEFGSITLQGWLADTLWIGDLDTKRLTLISPEGELIRSVLWPAGIRFPPGTPTPVPSFIFVAPRALYQDGSLLVFAYLADEQHATSLSRPPLGLQPLLRVTSDGNFVRVIAWTLRPNEGCYFSPPGAARSRIPLCFQPIWAIAPDGSLITLARVLRSDDTNDFVQITTVSARGDTLFSSVFPIRRVVIPRRIADSVITSYAAQFARTNLANAYRGMKLPSTFPPLQNILLGRDGTVWFEGGNISGDREWHILGSAGQSLGTLLLSRRTDLKVVSRTVVWGTERDADGLESIVRLRVNPVR
jgi:hypothetical protein